MTDSNPNRVNRRSVVIQFDRDRNLQDMVRQQADAAPEAVAVDIDDNAMTFSELDCLSESLAHHLSAQGVIKGGTVALLLPNTITTVVAKLAILKIGAAYIPLESTLPPAHIEQILLHFRPNLVVTDAKRRRQLTPRGVNAPALDIDETLARPTATSMVLSKSVQVGGDDIAYILPEISLTGVVGGVAVKHRAISRVALDQSYIKFGQGDVILKTSAKWFDAEAVELWGALLTGCALVAMPAPPFSMGRLCSLIRKAGVTKMFLTTEVFNRLADRGTGDLPSLAHVIFGGTVGSAEHVGRFLKAYPSCKVTNAYGPEDANAFETAIPAAGSAPDQSIKRRRSTRASAGRTAPGNSVSMDVSGEIAGKHPDIVEIEAALRSDPRLRDGIVISYDESPQTRLVAYLRPQSAGAGEHPHFVRQIMARLRGTLPANLIPDCAVVLDDFPIDQTGNVERGKLPPPPNPATLEAVSSVAVNQTEVMLTELWQGILGRSNIGLDRNFFDLGGTSLQLIDAHARLEARLGHAIDVVSLFTYSTIRDLSRFLDGRVPGSARAMSATQRATLQRQTSLQFRRNVL